MGDRYAALHRGQIHLDYIQTNRDAGATRLDVFSVDNEKLQGGFMLCFLDDGYGMSPEESSDVIFFGMSRKRIAASRFIGHYGNGLKSGSMRIGKDFILFTKKEETMTCIFLSQTFCESEGLSEVVVPIPSWCSRTKESITEPKKFSEELSIIQKYSPFKTEAELMQQFDKIYRKSGTLVVIYNLKLMLNGEPELDIKTNKEDILIAGVLEDLPERWSFRAYTSVLYFDPRMRIFIQTKRVQTKHLSYCLYRPRKYLYVTSSFKGVSKNEVKKAEVAVKIAEQMVREARYKIKSVRTGLPSAKDMLKKALEDAELKQKTLKEKEKELKKPKKLYLIFGVNIENRSQDGMFIYSNCRLIKMHEKVGPQSKPGSLLGAGVVGIVNIPLEVMEPSHNKQGFLDIKEYNHLLKIMGLYLVQYWKDTGFSNKNPILFWNEFGYQSSKWLEKPLNSARYRRRQAREIPFIIQCDLCLKWRVLPSSDDYKKRENLGNWTCADNPNLLENSCHRPEQLPSLPLGTMKQVSSSSENEKEKQLRDSVQRYQNKLAEQQSQNSYFVPANKTTEFLPSSQASAPKEYPKSRTAMPRRDALERDTCSSSVVWTSHLSQKRRWSRTDSTPSHVFEGRIPETTVRGKVRVKQPRHSENIKINENSQVSSWVAKREPHQGFVKGSKIIIDDEDSGSDPDLIMFADENDAVMTLKREKEEPVQNKGLDSAEGKPYLCANTREIKQNSSPLLLESLSTGDRSPCTDKKENVFMKESDVAFPLIKPPQSTCVKKTVEKLMAQLREILLYFHPHCKLSKDVDCKSMEELMAMCELENCPEQLNKKLQMCCEQIWSVYMVQYEKKVRRKMQSITQQANKTAMNNEAHYKQCEKQIKITENKLRSLRAKVSTLLRNWNLSTSDDLENIDSYVEALLNEENLFLPDTLKLVTRKSGQGLPSCEE
uniref:MORC family CW-type zinc finger 1 n=1 Tax=Monodelphis domestica TaxID=13616 RepID=A0A5F8GJX8_MONDO